MLAPHTKEEMTSYYEEIWENPRDFRNAIFQKLNEYVASRVGEGFGRTALDLGSGKGAIIRILLEHGYDVTGVEIGEKLAADLRLKYPRAEIFCSDVNSFSSETRYDLVTCIELTQNLSRGDLADLLKRLTRMAGKLLLNISNANSLHGKWVRWRGFLAPFVHEYHPDVLEQMLRDAAWVVTHRMGIGCVTPISLFSNFRCKLIPVWLVNALNRFLDAYFTNHCHVYYVEAVNPAFLP